MKNLLTKFDDIMYSIIAECIDEILLASSIMIILLIIFKTKSINSGVFKDIPDEY